MNKGTEELVARKGNAVTGNYYLAECGNCGEMFTSERMTGGGPIADTGDYGDCYCPHCDIDDSEIIDCGTANEEAAKAWNYQQKHIDELIAALEQAQHKESVNWEAATSLVEENEELKDQVRQIDMANSVLQEKLEQANLRLSQQQSVAANNLDMFRLAEKRIAELEAASVKPLPIGELLQRLEDQTGEPWGDRYLEPRRLSVKLPAHKFRECVNGLLEEAIAYAGTQQLRERLSSRLANFIQEDHPHTRCTGGQLEGSD